MSLRTHLEAAVEEPQCGEHSDAFTETKAEVDERCDQKAATQHEARAELRAEHTAQESTRRMCGV
eukprot:364769-Chlamydomonas_euryale.AAC.4